MIKAFVRCWGSNGRVVSVEPVKKQEKKKRERKIVRPQELPWPENLITEIGLEYTFSETKEYESLNDDQMDGLADDMQKSANASWDTDQRWDEASSWDFANEGTEDCKPDVQ